MSGDDNVVSTAIETELRVLLSEAMDALWNVQGVLNLIREEGTTGLADFPASIGSALRMMSFQVDSVVTAIDPRM